MRSGGVLTVSCVGVKAVMKSQYIGQSATIATTIRMIHTTMPGRCSPDGDALFTRDTTSHDDNPLQANVQRSAPRRQEHAEGTEEETSLSSLLFVFFASSRFGFNRISPNTPRRSAGSGTARPRPRR